MYSSLFNMSLTYFQVNVQYTVIYTVPDHHVIRYALVICMYGPLPPSMAGKCREFLVT